MSSLGAAVVPELATDDSFRCKRFGFGNQKRLSSYEFRMRALSLKIAQSFSFSREIGEPSLSNGMFASTCMRVGFARRFLCR